MNFVLKPSLEHMALVKIVISLWNQNDIRSLLAKHGFLQYFFNRSDEWKKIEEKVQEKVPQLSLPQPIQEKVLGYIKPIGLQILDCIKYNFKCFKLLNLPLEFCWTPQGTVDRKKTAKVLLNDEKLDMPTRYIMACVYCFENDICKFWNSISEDHKKDFLGTVWDQLNLHESSASHILSIVSFWSQTMKRRRFAYTAYKEDFHDCAQWGNIEATEYFLHKLISCEREESLIETAKNLHKADVLYFLLSEMKEEQQVEVFKSNPYTVLKCFLQWPLQSFFIKIANRMWDFLSKTQYEDILKDIIYKVKDGYKDWNYQNLFKEFWKESPSALKSLITNEIDKSTLLICLFHVKHKDKEIIRLILKDTTLTAKEKLIYTDKMNDYCKYFMHIEDWDFLEFFIRECLPSKNDMLKFKKVFEKCLMHSYLKNHLLKNKHKWDKLFYFSDDSVCKDNKRTVEDGESSSSKRFLKLK